MKERREPDNVLFGPFVAPIVVIVREVTINEVGRNSVEVEVGADAVPLVFPDFHTDVCAEVHVVALIASRRETPSVLVSVFPSERVVNFGLKVKLFE